MSCPSLLRGTAKKAVFGPIRNDFLVCGLGGYSPCIRSGVQEDIFIFDHILQFSEYKNVQLGWVGGDLAWSSSLLTWHWGVPMALALVLLDAPIYYYFKIFCFCKVFNTFPISLQT